MMKRFLALFLALTLTFILAACSATVTVDTKKSDKDDKDEKTSEASSVEATSKEEDKTESKDESKETVSKEEESKNEESEEESFEPSPSDKQPEESKEDESSEPEVSEPEVSEPVESLPEDSTPDVSEPETSKPEGSVNENGNVGDIVLYDDKDVKVVATGAISKSYGAINIKLNIENNTANKLTFTIKDVSVNDYMVFGSLYSEVSAGKKASENITLYEDDLLASDISALQDIEFKLHVYHTESYDDYLTSDVLGLKVIGNENYVQKYDTNGVVVHDANDVKVIARSILETGSEYSPYAIVFYVENNSNMDFTLCTDDDSLNGYMMPYMGMYQSLGAGKRAVVHVDITDDELEESGITSIQEYSFTLKAFDSNYNTIFETKEYTVTFN